MKTTNQKPGLPLALLHAAPFLICLLVLLPQRSNGQLYLTGLTQNGTAPSGQTAGSPIFNTLGNEASFANMYVTQPNAGYNAPLINSGNGSSASIAYALTPGSYEFYFFQMGFWDNNPGNYALNLFFNGDNTNPGIAAYSPANTSTATAIPAGLATVSLSVALNIYVPSPGSLVYTANGLSVTLTAYGFGEPGVFGGPPADRVGNLNSLPDGYTDSVGRFTLSVVAVPEPSAFAVGCVAVVVFRSRRNKGFKRYVPRRSDRKFAPEHLCRLSTPLNTPAPATPL